MNDPRLLKTRIAELERAAKLVPAPVVRKVGKTKTVEVSVFREADLKRIEKLAEKLSSREDGFKELLTTVVGRVAQAQQAVVSELGNVRSVLTKAVQLRGVPAAASSVKPMNPLNAAPRPPKQIRAEAAGRRAADGHRSTFVNPSDAGYRGNDGHDTVNAAGTSPMPEKCQKMLGALRQGEAMGLSSMPFHTVAILAGVAPNSGTTGNRKGFLKNNGYITVQSDHVQLTDKGREYPIDVALPPTDRLELLDFWKRQIKTEKICAMLDFVVRNDGATDDELAAAAPMAKSGTFGNYKGALIGRGLMVKVSNGVYKPAEAFRR